MYVKIKKEWKLHLQSNVFRFHLIATLIFFISVVHSCTKWISFLESRNGIILTDPFLDIFKRPFNSYISK